MERLTNKWKDNLYDTFDPIDIVDNEYSKINYEKLLVKLGNYEDSEEQGELVKLPCKVGDKVYAITRDFISEYEVAGFYINRYGLSLVQWRLIDGIYINVHGFYPHEIGTNIFLDKEEAEQKLKLKGAGNEIHSSRNI